MTFRTDRRGRVPFAIVGMVLLLGSVAFTVGIQPDRPPAEPAVDVVVDRTTATTHTELRAAVASASEAAAREPVLEPADTPAGRVLDEEHAFRDALRMRIYLRLRDRLDGTTVKHGDVTGRVRLPATPNASALAAATDRVRLQPVGENATAVRVEVRNVTVTAERDGQRVAATTVSPTVVVESPVLAVHERVRRFDERLNAGLTERGLARRLTRRLYAVTWARGYAQWGSGGEAITNVVSNRHVEVMTNDAVLQEQAATFGRSDAAGRRTMRYAIAGVGVTDVLAEGRFDTAWLESLFRGGPPGTNVPASVPQVTDELDGGRPRAGDDVDVAVDSSANRAFAHVTDGSNLTETLQSVYSADVKLLASIEERSGAIPQCLSTDGDQVRLADEDVDTDAEVVGSEPSAPDLSSGADWHVLAEATRTVRLEFELTCRWQTTGDGMTETEQTGTTTDEIELALVARHAHSEHAPRRPIDGVHEAGEGPFDGPNLAGVPERAETRVLGVNGGFDGIAERVAAEDTDGLPLEFVRGVPHDADHRYGEDGSDHVVVRGPMPAGLRRWVVADLARMRGTVENVSTTVERGQVATYEDDPAGELRHRLDDRREDLLDVPTTYGSVAEKARVAARGAYVDETRRLLGARRDRRRSRRGNVDAVLEHLDAGSIDLLQRARASSRVRDEAGDGPGVEIVGVDGSPAYLPTAEVDSSYAPTLPADATIHPLAVRNVNLFTSPHGDVTDDILSSIGLGEEVSFRSGARTLAAVSAATERGLRNETTQQSLRDREAALEDEIEGSLWAVKRHYLVSGLDAAGVGGSDGRRLEVVETGLDRWDSTAATALAVSNGSAAEAIADVAVDDNETRDALARAHLQNEIHRAQRSGDLDVALAVVNRTANEMRERLGAELETAVEAGMRRGGDVVAERAERRLGRSLNRVPAGLPVVPLGPAWWTTTNIWYVAVDGGYDRFAVRARAGDGRGPGTVTYVRDGSPVRLDYDADGTAEVVGHGERVSFRVRTAVGIAVPPGAAGVGDKDGQLDERSDGWDDWADVSPDVDADGGRRVPADWPSRDGE